MQDLAAEQRRHAADLGTCNQALEAQKQLQKQLHLEQLREKDLELETVRRDLDKEVAAIKALLAAPVGGPEHAVSVWVGNGLLANKPLQAAPGCLSVSQLLVPGCTAS